jgi:hypothetical protein
VYQYHLDPDAGRVLAGERADRLRQSMIAARRTGQLEPDRRQQPAWSGLERLLRALASARRTVL